MYSSLKESALLLQNREPIGVIRIDVIEDVAWFRRVAIALGKQKSGHGRELISRAELFARYCGASRVLSSVDRDAIGFYIKMGYQSRNQDQAVMYKLLGQEHEVPAI